MLLSVNEFQISIAWLHVSMLCLVLSSKPYTKRQQAIWRVECELGVISDPECPIDGGWAPWSAWSPCHGPCDDTGHRRRTRKCINPPPSEDGIPCGGPEEELEPCYLKNCTIDDFRKLVEGDFVRAKAFHQLEAVPALMERCLQMECPFEAIEEALAGDNTWQLNSEALWNSFQCVKHNMGCPVRGEWGTWGHWSACGARCGQGFRWRLRRCDTPPPSAAHLACDDLPLQAEECEGDQCAVDVRDIERDATGTWSPWGGWSECSENCGLGVRRRRRICNEYVKPRVDGTWGTHCAGQHDEFEVCERKECLLHGGWSGWGAWGPCSQNCGAGKKSRTRSCTRPIPAGGGNPCVGPRTEIASCYLTPCLAYSHTVALFNGDSSLQYNLLNKRATLFHFYVRFMPLSPHGTLVRRGAVQGPHVRLSIQKWHICLDASGTFKACALPRICSPTFIEPALWHSVLVTVTSQAATLRVDDAKVPIKGTFPCDPELRDERMNILIGEKLHGAIQNMALNFIPLDTVIYRNHETKRSDFVPSAASNIIYETADIDEAYMLLENDQYMRLPCFSDQNEWQLELTIKPKREAGTIMFLIDDATGNWLHMGLLNMRLKFKIAVGDFRSESSSSTECPPDQWLDVTLSKKKETNTIEASINSGERLHVVLEEERTRDRRDSESISMFRHNIKNNFDAKPCNVPKMGSITRKSVLSTICNDEFFVGGVPESVKLHISEDFTSFSGVIASISINNVLQDLHEFGVERDRDGEIQVSSKTASVSGSYHEIAWGNSNRLNLTCLHARTARSPQTARWLFLDTDIKGAVRDKIVRSVDDGRILRLVASGDNDLRGFYTCRAHANKYSLNIVTYGVLGKVKYNLSGINTTTAVAVISTLFLVIGTLAWLVIEGFHDLRNGFGFFRDAHLSPEEEAEAVCKYIDDNMDLMGSESAANIAKARARRKGQRLASRASFGAQEPQGLNQVENIMMSSSDHETASEPEDLPALPEINCSCNSITAPATAGTLSVEPSHEVYRCEQSFISSPRHGSNFSSPRNKLTSSSSCDLTSPRVLCSRLLLARRLYSSRETLTSKRNRSAHSRHFDSPRKPRSNLLTIKSSTCVETSIQSPAQKILQKFHQLRSDDL